MRIVFRQTGGWAAMVKECRLDTAAMERQDAETLVRLLEGSRALDAKGGRSPKARDAQQYELTVESGGATRTVTFDDTTVPAEAWPLIEFLVERAKPRPASGGTL